MSVTLKLHDKDAEIISDLIQRVNQYNQRVNEEGETGAILNTLHHEVGSPSMIKRLTEIQGAFTIAVRANSR